MAIARYEAHDLDHLGVAARQLTVTCQHGETTRVVVRTRAQRFPADYELLRATTEEHEATFGCGCAQRFARSGPVRRRGRA